MFWKTSQSGSDDTSPRVVLTTASSLRHVPGTTSKAVASLLHQKSALFAFGIPLLSYYLKIFNSCNWMQSAEKYPLRKAVRKSPYHGKCPHIAGKGSRSAHDLTATELILTFGLFQFLKCPGCFGNIFENIVVSIPIGWKFHHETVLYSGALFARHIGTSVSFWRGCSLCRILPPSIHSFMSLLMLATKK